VIIRWWILSIQSTCTIPCIVWACNSIFNIHESRWNDQEVQEGIIALKDVAYQGDEFLKLRVIAIGRTADLCFFNLAVFFFFSLPTNHA